MKLLIRPMFSPFSCYFIFRWSALCSQTSSICILPGVRNQVSHLYTTSLIRLYIFRTKICCCCYYRHHHYYCFYFSSWHNKRNASLTGWKYFDMVASHMDIYVYLFWLFQMQDKAVVCISTTLRINVSCSYSTRETNTRSLPWLTSSCISNRFHARGLLIALMMEAARTSETLVNFYQTTRRYNPENSHLRTHRRENLKSY
jgi:hypothetical protein